MSESRNSYLVNLVAGGMAGASVDIILYPLDTIKTRLQSQQNSLKIKGATSQLFRGLSAAVAASFPCAAVFWSTYEGTKTELTRKFELKEDDSRLPLVHMVSAAGAEILTAVVRNPFEIIKQQMQAGIHDTAVGAMKSIIKTDGVRGLYNGYSSLVLREIPFDMMQFVLYEQLKVQRRKFKGAELTAIDNMMTGSVAGGFTAICTTPLDVVKTRLMLQSGSAVVKYQGIQHTFTTIIAEEGVRSLFSGAKTRCAWISLGGAVFFGGFEEFRRIVEKII